MIELRKIEEQDLDRIRGWRNSHAIRKWCRQTDLISVQDQKKWYESQNSDPSIKMYAILGNGQVAGVCGLTSIDYINRRAEFSCYIGLEHQRKGYASQALQALFNHGFKELGLKVIWGESFEGNPAMELFEALGMTLEGIRRSFYFKNGKFIDAHLYSLLDSEWRF